MNCWLFAMDIHMMWTEVANNIECIKIQKEKGSQKNSCCMLFES